MHFWLLMLLVLSRSGLAQAVPSDAEQSELIAEVRRQALAYVDNLPNFICTQETRRSSASVKSPEQWKLMDTLSIRLTYFGKKEDYRVVSVNGKPADKSFSDLKGWKTQGDFGSTLLAVFRAKSETKFAWQQWAEFQGRRVAVVKYRVDVEHSPFQTAAGGPVHTTRVNWAAEGLVYADAETKQVLRLTVNSVEMPEKFAVREIHIDSEFAPQKIGDRDFLLPARSVSTTATEKELRKSDSRFTDYRKFSAETEIKFGETGK